MKSNWRNSGEKILAAIVVIASILALVGWHFGVEVLKCPPPGKVPMNPLTAIGFVAAGLSLFFVRSRRRRLVQMLAAVTAFAGLARLIDVLGFHLEFDRLLYTSALNGNRMAPNTAFGLLTIACAIAFTRFRRPGLRRFSDYFNALTLVISLLTLTGYLYETEAMYGVSSFVPMALSSGLAFLLLSIGVCFTRRNEGLAAILFANDLGGAVARRLLPVVVFVPLLLGALRLYGQRAGWFDFQFGAALLVVMTMFTLFVLTWRCAKYLSEIDRAYKEQSRLLAGALKANNKALERKVGEGLGELNQAHAQIQQLQKLDAVGRLAGGIAHDFNNILGAVMMHTDLIARNLGDTAIVKDSTEQIQRAAERGASLSRQLLIFSRKKVAEHQAVQLNHLMNDHFKMLKRLIGENIQIDFKLNEKLPMIFADPGQIEQVIMNLVINARDAMPEGGKLTIETRSEDLTEEFASAHLLSQLGPHVLLSITDTGCGMTEETKSRIFEPFFTTKSVGRGTGLGLATVYGIVKSLNGTIWVYSEIGRGTVFKIYIPASQIGAPAPKIAQDARRLEGGETILVVEDESTLRDLYSDVLRKHGYKVLVAENGLRAWEIFEPRRDTIDLIVTDMIMPELNGHDLVQLVLAEAPKTKILCVSGYPGENEPTLSEGRLGYLQKPFNTVQLISKIRDLLASTADKIGA